MRQIMAIAAREIQMGFRNPWSYSFMGLFTLFSLALTLLNAQEFVQGYTSTSGTMLNLILYLLPLMTLLLGSFSLTIEKEEGSWQLLSTYPLRTFLFVLGKYLGMFVVLFTIIAFGYGLTGVISFLLGKAFAFSSFVLLFLFSGGLIALFLALAIGIGTITKNRWQALTVGVSLWFFTVIGWSTILIALLGTLPYAYIKPMIVLLTLLNPAEFVRLFIITKLGGGSILGPEYFTFVQSMRGLEGTIFFVVFSLLWIASLLCLAVLFWERGRTRV